MAQAQRPARAWYGLRPFNTPISNWAGKTVWLVGASSGIGAALARQLAHSGARVLASARHADALKAVARDAQGAPGKIHAVPLDTTDPASIERAMADMARLTGGSLDLVVYCAGHYQGMRATDMDLSQMIRHIDVNQIGALRVLDAVLPGMLARQQGHICLISSVAGYRGLPQSLAYGPTKAALTNLAENLYLDLHEHGIGVSVVHPGFVQTPLTAQNGFHMPALITPEQAAQAMTEGWAKGHFNIHFPKRFTRWMALLRILPLRLYFQLVKRVTGL
ncbi:SDR family NAD(P)-dependent oxidoreductase [Hydrogenophaga sp. 5NK40-0174]|uniref:SDR family NAD(P)-dependent oxidoreductase n=1 Tax=Hydrogenophaga sp. 5NK40-0174 TaxID=3127649 RepID=UPI0031023B62